MLFLKDSKTEDLFVGTKELTAASRDTVEDQEGCDSGSQYVLSTPGPRMGFQPPEQVLLESKGA